MPDIDKEVSPDPAAKQAADAAAAATEAKNQPDVAAPEAAKQIADADTATQAEKQAASEAANQALDSDITETLDATVAQGIAAPALEKPDQIKYDPNQYQDKTRSYIAYWLLMLLTLLVIFGFSALFLLDKPASFENLKSILELIFGPLVALVSAATGFYFGAQQPGKQP